jgi:hypothetical protein
MGMSRLTILTESSACYERIVPLKDLSACVCLNIVVRQGRFASTAWTFDLAPIAVLELSTDPTGVTIGACFWSMGAIR